MTENEYYPAAGQGNARLTLEMVLGRKGWSLIGVVIAVIAVITTQGAGAEAVNELFRDFDPSG